jgi:hypothetical protein
MRAMMIFPETHVVTIGTKQRLEMNRAEMVDDLAPVHMGDHHRDHHPFHFSLFFFSIKKKGNKVLLYTTIEHGRLGTQQGETNSGILLKPQPFWRQSKFLRTAFYFFKLGFIFKNTNVAKKNLLFYFILSLFCPNNIDMPLKTP